MEQVSIHPYLILTIILLFVSIFCALTYGGYRLFARIHGKFKKIIIEPENEDCSDL